MKAILFRTDVKNILRDRSLLSVAVVPPVIFAIMLFGLPPLMQLFPQALPYRWAIIGIFTLLNALFPAYIFSFAMLDERDQHLVPVIRVMPMSPAGFYMYRLGLTWTIAFISCLATLWAAPVLAPLSLIGAAFGLSSIAPLTQLFIVSMAHNKIEGVSYFKFINMLWMLPVIPYIVPFKGQVLAGLVPSYWAFGWLAKGHIDGISFGLFMAESVLLSYFLFRRLMKKV